MLPRPPSTCLSNSLSGFATEHLLGEGIEAKHLNDDRLGRVLDQLWEAGLTALFVKVAGSSRFCVSMV